MIIDKNCNRQILGSLMQHPQFLSETDKYSLTIDDFSTSLEKYVFMAISGLYANGAKTINPIDVENFLETSPVAKNVFVKQKGIEYLQDSIDFSSVENFGYYYNKLKKFNLLNSLQKTGIDITDFYCEDLTKQDAFEINDNFEALTIPDILESIKKKLYKLEHDFMRNDVTEVESIADGIDDFIDNLVEEYSIGLPLQGEIFNEIVGGAQFGTLTIRSMPSGVGKTRQSVGDACLLAFPFRYDASEAQWVQVGNNEKVLFIATEQSFKEIRKMILAYLTGINEDKFKYTSFTNEERIRIKQATELIKEYKDNFYIVRMPNPTIELAKSIIRENCLMYGIEYVFYDYIFIGPALLNEFRGFTLRNDEVLLMFATALKDIAVEQNVYIMTSTQVNANADNNKDIRNEASLAGGRSTINKADIGLICNRPTTEELETLGDLCRRYGEPNIVSDIFKVRGGRWTQVRIWSYMDLGTMRKKDLFVTDARLHSVPDFENRENIQITSFEDIDIFAERLNKLNNELL